VLGKPKLSPASSRKHFTLHPKLELAADHDARLLAVMGVRGGARRRSGREPAREQFELSIERRAQEFVDDAVGKIEPPPARAPDDVIALAGRDFSRIEEPADGDAQRPADRMQRIDRGRRQVALEKTQIADGQIGFRGKHGERVPPRFAQSANLAAEPAHRLGGAGRRTRPATRMHARRPVVRKARGRPHGRARRAAGRRIRHLSSVKKMAYIFY
jgi:hypothetical protein